MKAISSDKISQKLVESWLQRNNSTDVDTAFKHTRNETRIEFEDRMIDLISDPPADKLVV